MGLRDLKKKVSELLVTNKENPYITIIKEYPTIFRDREEMEKLKGRWSSIFKNDNPICLEIGSGSGSLLVNKAKNNPDMNFIGMELRFKRLVASASKAEKLQLNNIIWLQRRGEDIDQIFNDQELTGIYVWFPDPWAKKRQKKHRLLQEPFFKKVFSLIAKDGTLFFKTDHDEYFESTCGLLQTSDLEIKYKTNDYYKENELVEEDSSEFEKLFYHQDKNINYLEAKKKNK